MGFEQVLDLCYQFVVLVFVYFYVIIFFQFLHMSKQSTFLVCNLDNKLVAGKSVESVGVLSTETLSAPLYSEVLRVVTYYLSEYRRVSGLCQGRGISTIRDVSILREWRRVEEILRPLAFNKIAELPAEERKVWYTILYREQMQMCFVLNQQGAVDDRILPQLQPLVLDVRRRRGRIASIVDQDPAGALVKDVLRLARVSARFSLMPHSVGPKVKGLQIVGPDYPLVSRALVQAHLFA